MQTFLIAGIPLFIGEDLRKYLPQRMYVFSDANNMSATIRPQLCVLTTSGLFCGTDMYCSKTRILRQSWRGQSFQALFSADTGLLQILTEDSKREHAAMQFCLMQFIRMAIGQILLRQGGFILHASAVEFNRCAILFSGLSGVGKSTQACLWEKYVGAEIMNHDSPMIVYDDNQFIAHGNPWSGSEKCYKQKSAPIKSLMVLSQNTVNRVVCVPEKEAVRFLLTQSLTRLFDACDMDLLIDNVRTFVRKVPIVRYGCRADQSAVLTLKEYLIRERIF